MKQLNSKITSILIKQSLVVPKVFINVAALQVCWFDLIRGINSQLKESNQPAGIKFGVVQQIFKCSFASKEFMWATLNLFKLVHFDAKCGLWRAENLMHSSFSTQDFTFPDDCN